MSLFTVYSPSSDGRSYSDGEAFHTAPGCTCWSGTIRAEQRSARTEPATGSKPISHASMSELQHAIPSQAVQYGDSHGRQWSTSLEYRTGKRVMFCVWDHAKPCTSELLELHIPGKGRGDL